MSRFAKSNGADNNKKDRLGLYSDDGDDNGSQSGVVFVVRDVGTTPQEIAAAPITSIARWSRATGRAGGTRWKGDSKKNDVSIVPSNVIL
jgi:hypothetical protein